MHLIVLENEPSSCRGGQEISLFDICQQLSKRGHSISLLHTNAGDLLEKYQSFCYTIPVKSYVISQSVPFRSILNFCRDVYRIPIDRQTLVYGNQYHNSFFGGALALSKNIPFVCHLRLPPPCALGIHAGVGLKCTNKLIAVSNHTKSDWLKAGFSDKKIAVVHNSVDLERFKPRSDRLVIKHQLNLPETAKIISYVGRLDKNKGLETLLNAFALLMHNKTENQTNIRLLIAGKPLIQQPSYREFLQQLAIDLGIAEMVSFLGHLSDLVPIYQVSDVVTVPSVWAEPFGRTILEGMACGTPVVASRVGGIPEVLGGEFEQWLAQPKDAQDLATKLHRSLHWREQDPGLGQRCRDYVSDNFPLEKTIDGVEQILLQVLQEKGRTKSANQQQI